MKRFSGIFGLAVLLITSFAVATTVKTVNIFDMVRLADRVFWGRCLSVENQIEESTGLPIVVYTFEVRQGIKGVQTGEKIVFRQASSSLKGGVPGLPHYQKGQEIVLFLHGNSRSGLTSPVGLAQGAFRIEKNRNRKIGVINGLKNRNLGYDLAFDQVVESGLTASDLGQIQKEEPIPLELFSSVVERIDRYQVRKGRSLR